MTLELVAILAAIIRLNWLFAGMVLTTMKAMGANPDNPWRKSNRTIWAELRPFYLPAVAVYIGKIVFEGEMSGWNIFFAAAALACWWIYKDVDEDDRWKRRRAKLVEKLERRGSRLVAVPAGGEA